MGPARPPLAARAADALLAATLMPVVGVLAACAVMAVFVCADLVWTDLLHANPYRSLTNVAAMLVLSPVYGLFLGVFLLGLPIGAGCLLTAVTTLVWQRPSLSGMAGIAVASTVLFVHRCYAAAEAGAETMDWRSYAPPWFTLIGGSALLTASLYAGWSVQGWMTARRERPAS